MIKDIQHKVWRLILDARRAGDVEEAAKEVFPQHSQ